MDDARKEQREDSSNLPPPVVGDFDLTDDHTEIYLALLEAPSATRNEFVRRGFEPEYVDKSMRAFERRGLARPLGYHVWEAIPPDIALPAFAARLEGYATTIRASTSALSRSYANRSADAPDPSGYDRLNSVEEIALATQQLLARSGTQVVGLRNDSPYTRYLLELPTDFHVTPVRNAQGVKLAARVTMDTSMIPHPRFNEVVTARQSTGELYRFHSGLPFSAIVNDRGLAVIDAHGPDGEALGLMISTPGAAAAVSNVAEWAWRLGREWRLAQEASGELDARDKRILELLSSGTTDSVVAKRLKVSQRTVERRVRELMDRLGATTRFQAGVLAAKDGLI